MTWGSVRGVDIIEEGRRVKGKEGRKEGRKED